MSPNNVPNSTSQPTWAEKAIDQFARDALREKRASRRWSIFFKLLTAFFILLFFYLVFFDHASSPKTTGPHTAVVNIEGIIFSEAEASADRVIGGLEAAYEDPNTKGIILKINSPGGTAVQSNLIANAVLRLKEKYPDIPLVTVVDEMCASGGYYIAAVTDEIYVNESSLVGSIGVKLDSFGFTGTMEKLGIERRLLSAGDQKGFLDPFSPMDERDRAHAQTLLDDMHDQFITIVKAGRGDRLKLDTPALFSGLVWTGRQSVGIGLADGVGDVATIAEEVIKAPEVVDFTLRESVAERLAKQLGTSAKVVTEKLSVHRSESAMMLYR